MLYSEFLSGTNAPQTSETFRQYETLNAIYMDCDHLEKADIYRMWKQTYGKQLKGDRAKAQAKFERLASYRRIFGQPDDATADMLYAAAKLLREQNMFGVYPVRVKDGDGITYTMERDGEINYHTIWKMCIEFDGEKRDTGLTYLFGDMRIGIA